MEIIKKKKTESPDDTEGNLLQSCYKHGWIAWLLLDISFVLIYKYVWQTCQQSLKLNNKHRTFFLNCVVPENIHYPPPHWGQKFQGEGGPKGAREASWLVIRFFSLMKNDVSMLWLAISLFSLVNKTVSLARRSSWLTNSTFLRA